jgi:2-oxoglutarate ferredoxin oxidoreductase subunit beta
MAACRRSDRRQSRPIASLLYLGISGDGDSASIGLGQFVHCVRRGVNMVYITENNGVYWPDQGPVLRHRRQGLQEQGRAASNMDSPLDLVSMALMVGATFVGRSFSGDKEQMVPLIMAAMSHPGPAFIDIVSPCVAFNNHAGSTKAYDFVRSHNEAVNRLDIMEPREASPWNTPPAPPRKWRCMTARP